MATWQDEIDRLSEENRKLKRQLKAQYKRAKLAEEVAREYGDIRQGEIAKMISLGNARDNAEQHARRLFVMLEHALEIKAKGIQGGVMGKLYITIKPGDNGAMVNGEFINIIATGNQNGLDVLKFEIMQHIQRIVQDMPVTLETDGQEASCPAKIN